MRLNDGPGNGKTKTPYITVAGCFKPHEGFKHLRQLILGQARTPVGHSDHRESRFLRQADLPVGCYRRLDGLQVTRRLRPFQFPPLSRHYPVHQMPGLSTSGVPSSGHGIRFDLMARGPCAPDDTLR